MTRRRPELDLLVVAIAVALLGFVVVMLGVKARPMAPGETPVSAPQMRSQTDGQPGTTVTVPTTTSTTRDGFNTGQVHSTDVSSVPIKSAPITHPADGVGWPYNRLADCESGAWDDDQPYGVVAGSADWTDLMGRYQGGLHFDFDTWDRYVAQFFPGYPADAQLATPAQQVTVARLLVERSGWARAFPGCSLRLGLR